MSGKVAESGKEEREMLEVEEQPVEAAVEVEVDGAAEGVSLSNSPPEPEPEAPAEDGGGSNEETAMTVSEFQSESAESVVKVGNESEKEGVVENEQGEDKEKKGEILEAIKTKEMEVDEEKEGKPVEAEVMNEDVEKEGETAVEGMDVDVEPSQSSSDTTSVPEPTVSFSFFKWPESKDYLEDVKRVELIKMHRNLVKESQKKLEQRQKSGADDKEKKRYSSFSKMTFAKLPLNLKFINLKQLDRILEAKNKKYDLEDRYIDKLFEDFEFLDSNPEEFRRSSQMLRELRASRKRRILNLVVIEDPVWMPLECTTHFLTQDSNGDVIPLSLYRSMPVPITSSQGSNDNGESDKENDPPLGLGSRLILIDPEQWVTSWPQDATKNNLLVVFPQDVLVDNGRIIDMCRYCGQENAAMKCEKCQEAKYCSEECRTNDLEKLGHELICVPK